jgi:hypothetical protein
MMLTTRNITSRTLQGFCHMKYTNLCNEEKRAKPSTPRHLTKSLTINNQTNTSKESNSAL